VTCEKDALSCCIVRGQRSHGLCVCVCVCVFARARVCAYVGETVAGGMGGSHFFDRVEDHLLAMLFSHLGGREVARLATVCSRWRDVVQGEGCDESIWKTLWRRGIYIYMCVYVYVCV